MIRPFCSWLFAGVALLATAGPAQAVPFTTATNTRGLSATASFSISGDLLTIVLTNTDVVLSGREWAPSEVLTGLFFNLGVSAYPLGVSREASVIATIGSSTGAHTGGIGTLPDSSPWGRQPALDGMEFGVLLSDLVRLQRNGAWSPEAVVKSAVAFVLDVPGTLTDQMISNVNFTYGTITN